MVIQLVKCPESDSILKPVGEQQGREKMNYMKTKHKNKMQFVDLPQQTFVLVKTCRRRLENVFSLSIFYLLRRLQKFKRLGKQKVVTLHYYKHRQP